MRKLPFVLASTDHGTMIVNRLDYNIDAENNSTYGVGIELLERAQFSGEDIRIIKRLLSALCEIRGDGIVALDAGANIGVHTIEWSKYMHSWGRVISVEAQERIFYALAGNISINNCFNVCAYNIALSDVNSEIKIPVPDYTMPASFGSLELKKSARNENIGQIVSYDENNMVSVAARTIDSFDLPRLDFLKIDVEGMELLVLKGAIRTISICHPVIFIEYIKVDKVKLEELLSSINYRFIYLGINILAYHNDDLISSRL